MSTFFNSYRIYNQASECPATFHLYGAMVALSSMLGRKVWLDMGYFQVYPNLYVTLVGPPGFRKSSALNGARALLNACGAPFISDSITKQKLVEDAGEQEISVPNLPPQFAEFSVYTPVTILATEISELIGPSAVGMTSFLTSVYDEQKDYSERTKNKGTTIIKRPAFNLLACTTPDWIRTYMKQDVIGGGFSRRVLFVFENRLPQRNALPVVTPEMQNAFNAAVSHMKRVGAVFGPFSFEPAAKDFYVNWYNNLKTPHDVVLANYYGSKHVQLLKLSMLVALSEDVRRVIKLDHIVTALSILDNIEVNIPRVFEGVGRNDLSAHVSSILDVIKQTTPLRAKINNEEGLYHFVPERQVAAALYRELGEREFQEVVAHLKSTNRLIVSEKQEPSLYGTLTVKYLVCPVNSTTPKPL